MKRKIAGLLVAFLRVCMAWCVPVKAADYMPMYLETSTCSVSLTFNNNTATCMLRVTGKNGATSISGKLKLYDVTTSQSVKTWSISKSGSTYTGSKAAAVQPGHTYRLKFTGKVVDASGNSESITKKVKKAN